MIKFKSQLTKITLIFSITVISISIAILFADLRKTVTSYNENLTITAQFEIFQIHRELLELIGALDRYQLSEGGETKEFLEKKFNIFRTRADRIHQGEAAEIIQRTEVGKYVAHNALSIMQKIEHRLLLLSKTDFATYLEIRSDLKHLKTYTSGMVLETKDIEVSQIYDNMQVLLKRNSRIPILIVVMVLSGGLLVAVILIENRRSDNLRNTLERRILEKTQELLSINGRFNKELIKHHETERDRQISEDRFRDFAQSTSDWLWETDSHLQGIYYSDRFTDEFDFDTQNAIEVTDIEAMRAYLDTPIWTAHSKILETHQPFKDLRYTRTRKNGTNQHISANGTPYFDGNGAFLGYRCAAKNTSRFRKAEQMITDARLQLARAVENLPSAFGLYDTDDRLVICNQEYKNIYYPVAELMEPGALYEDLLWAYGRSLNFAETDADLELWVHQRLDRRKNPACNLNYEYKPNHWVEVNDYNLPDGGIIFVGYEVTDKRQLQDQLGQAQKMEAVGQLTGGIAHDFNNILAIILGNSELLHEQLTQETEGQLSHFTQSIIKAAEHGADLTHRLLAFSRKSPLSPDAINLEKKISDMTDLMRRSMGEKVEIKTITADGLWSCQADASQVENAILNLCINARDAMTNGGTVSIATDNVTVDQDYSSLHSDVRKGDYVRITVTDTGTGIPPDVLEHVLEPFFTTKNVGEGSGLGLSMVYGFANQSNGHITIDSSVGQGTTIGLYLPRSEALIETRKIQKNTQISDAKEEVILVVEDDHDLRALAVTTLKNLGYVALEAKDGKSAKAALDRHKIIDLLLTDVVLPGDWDGPAISNYALKNYPHIKTLFMSGYTENAFENTSLADAGYHLLNKPFRRKELAAKLRELLDDTVL